MQQSVYGNKKYIKLFIITTKKREYNTEYQKQILTMYEEGKSFDEINKCRLNQQGICQATIYMFLDTYKIPKRVKKGGKICLPVQLNYIENVEKSKSISKQDFDEQDAQNITCLQERNQYFEVLMFEHCLYQLQQKLDNSDAKINLQQSLQQVKQYSETEQKVILILLFKCVFRNWKMTQYKLQCDESSSDNELIYSQQPENLLLQQSKLNDQDKINQEFSNYLFSLINNEMFSCLKIFKLMLNSEAECMQLSEYMKQYMIYTEEWDQCLFLFVHNDDFLSTKTFISKIKIDNLTLTFLIIEQMSDLK
ncbi:Hypothetical_protein [Hexamita inflata]|uniref:Hypothetical_protein n=1 Tax=Hexamita inflata TaxID=28002 RepID=A0AA86UL41_9EUKA|nr:Hypothetical protein HINF_LOCUS47474 [Hexamita inflata]